MTPEGRHVRFRLYYFAAVVFHVFSCAGAFFGFNSMARIFLREGAFKAHCAEPQLTGQAACAKPQQIFGLIYTISSVVGLIAPLASGLMTERFGPSATVRLFTSIWALGVALMLVASTAVGTAGSDAAIWAAFVLIGAAAAANSIPLYSVAALFPTRRSTALAFISGSFDASSAVFVIFERIVGGGVKLRDILIGYLAGPIFIVALFALFLWPSRPFGEPGALPPESPPAQPRAPEAETEAAPMPAHAPKPVSAPADVLAPADAPARSGGSPLRIAIPQISEVAAAGKGSHSPFAVALPSPHFLPGINSASLRAMSFIEQVRQPAFYLFIASFSSNVLLLTFYFSVLGPLLSEKGDNGDNISMFSAVLPSVGILSVVASGFILDTCGPVPAFALLSCYGVLVAAISRSPTLEIQPLAFACFACFRGFLFSVMSAFLGSTFGFEHLTSLVGLTTLCGGLVGLLSIPIADYAYAAGVTQSFNMFIALQLAGFAWPLWLWRHSAVEGEGR